MGGGEAPAWCSPAELVERLRAIPSSHRRFTATPQQARDDWGVGPELLDELLGLGLPARLVGTRPRLDELDLTNVTLHLGLRSAHSRATQERRRTLETVAAQASARFTVDYTATCQEHGGRANGGYSFLVPPGERVKTERNAHTFDVERPARWPELPPEAAELAERVSDLWFFLLPLGLRGDVGFARANRMAGCETAARIVLQESRRTKLSVRLRYGLLLSPPMATPHAWTEVCVDGTWVPFDPHLVRTLVRLAGLDEAEWPATRSPGAIVAPLAGDFRALGRVAMHDGHPASLAAVSRLHRPSRRERA